MLKFSGQMDSDRYFYAVLFATKFAELSVLSQAGSWGLLVNIPGPGAATSNVKVSR